MSVDGTAVAELWLFAYYPGFAESDTAPPSIDPRRLAAYLRSILEEMNRQTNDRANVLRSELDLKRLHQALSAYEKELVRLKTQLAELAEPPPWNETPAEPEV